MSGERMKFSALTETLKPGIFAELAAKKRAYIAAGGEVIDLSVGTPDIPPSRAVMEAISSAAMKGENYIYAIDDLPELRRAAADWYKRRFSVALDPESEICSLLGSQDGLAHIAMVLCDKGDTVLVPDPGYPVFSLGPTIAGARVYPVPLRPENGYIMDLDAVPEDVAEKAKYIMVSYPNNPTAALADDDFYIKLIAFAKKHDIIVVHDNAYCELVFTGRRWGSFLAYPGAKDVGIELNSLSKSYSMPGCRTGFAFGNAEIIKCLQTLKSQMDYGMFLPVQYAAIAALQTGDDEPRRAREIYMSRAKTLVSAMHSAGWDIPMPAATMFAWAPIPNGWNSAAEFAGELLEKTGVAVTPGEAFGDMGRGHVRFALVQSEEKLLLAAERADRAGIIGGAR